MSSTTVQGGNGLCDYCHQKPKHGNYDFCGKTCSLQASATPSLCKQCQQKPPFQNFDFCGKHCASLWQANHPGLGNGFPSTAQTSGSGLLKLKMPNINMPSLQNIKAQPLQPHPQNQLLPAPQMPPVVKGGHGVKSNRSPPSNVNKAIAPPVMPPPPPQQQSTSSRKGGSGNNVLTPAPPGICRIQGCGKPVHAAGTRNPSEYCSLRHREEAVELGADPCIMCRKLPRGVTDHFCSTTCRNAALRP